MKVMVLGATGQVGLCLRDTAPDGLDVIYLNRSQCDLSDLTNCAVPILQHQPDVVINAAAYTQVDKAEQEPELANRINGEAVGVIASACEQVGAKFIQISTDYVFDGSSSTPYKPNDPVNPINQYGRSKALGEKLAQENCARTVVVRTSWVYSQYGHNFLKTMLRVIPERDEIAVVGDQIGAPTYAANLAGCLWKFAISTTDKGIFHFTDDGVASWYDFACAIRQQMAALSATPGLGIIKKIGSCDYQTAAARPSYSLLDNCLTGNTLSLTRQHWGEAVKVCLSRNTANKPT